MPNKMERFTQRARRVLSLAHEDAERLRHNSIGTQHLLLGLMREEGGMGSRVLRDLGLDPRRVELLVEEMTPEQQRTPNNRLELSQDSKKILEFAVDDARRLGHHYIGTEHLLLGLVRQECLALDILKRLNISPEEVRRQTRRVMQESPVVTGASTQTRQGVSSSQPTVGVPRSPHAAYLSGEWRVVLYKATEEAKRLNHNRIGTEHVLLAFVLDRLDRAGYLLRSLGLSIDQVRLSLPPVPVSDQKPEESLRAFSPHLIAALGIAVAEAFRTEAPFLQSEHLLLGIVHGEDSPAMAILAKAGITAEQVKNAIQNVMK